MKRGGKTFICLLGGIALTMGAKAITGDPTSVKHGESTNLIVGTNNAGDNPYGGIVERNVFDLKDPPPPVDTSAVTNAPPPNVTLTGIMTIFGQTQALFLLQKAATPGKPPDSPESLIMTEGQRQGGLEVLEIDKADKKVKIKNDGIVSTITFEAHKEGAGAAPGQPGPHTGRGGFNPNMMNPSAVAPLPTRPVRTPDFSQLAPQGSANPGGAYNPQGGYNAGGISAVGYNQGTAQNQQSQLTPEEQTALILANQQVHQNEIAAGSYPPIPPLIPALSGEPASGQQLSGAGTGQQSTGQSPNANLPSWLQPRGTPPVPH